MNHKFRKPFAVMTTAALAASLLLGTGATAFAAETTTTTTIQTTYPDVKEGHWARTNVAKLAAAKVFKGYSNGNFGPNDNVIQQDAIVMLIRMLGLEDRALSENNGKDVGFSVNDYAKPHVFEAVEEGIISLVDETNAAQTAEHWGKMPATREWIASLVVRAIGEQPANAAVVFADAADISEAREGYVAKAVELGLIEGIVTNGKTFFKPKDAVTRAQIATILSRADKYIADDETKYASGFVTSVSGSSLVMQSSAGTSRTFGLNAETLVVDVDGRAIGADGLTSLTPIRVIHQDGQAYFVEATGGAIELETIDGEVEAIDIADSSLVLRLANGTMAPYELSPNATVTNAAGVGLSLSQLTVGSDIRLQRAAGTEEVSAIVLIEEAYNAEGTAMVEAMNATNRSVTFRDSQGSIVTYPIAADATLTLKGQPMADLNELQIGDTFAYVIKDSVVVSIDVTAQKFITKSGEFLVLTGDTLTIKANGATPEAYLVEPNPVIAIEGLNNPGVGDLQPGDLVQLRLSGTSNKVDRITVTSRNVSQLTNVTIEIVEDDYLTVRDSRGKAHYFEITNKSEFVLDGVGMTSSLYDDYVATGRKVNLNVTENQLVRLDVITKLSGTITAINSPSRMISVKTEGDETVTVPYGQYVAVEVPQQSSAGLADVTVGAKAHLSMNYNTNEISSIQLEKSFVYVLSSVLPSSRTFSVKDAKGAVSTITLSSDSRVLGTDGQSVALSSFVAGDPVLVTYKGRNIAEVQQPAVVQGKVSTLDTTAGKLSVTDYNKNVKTFSLSGGITVQEGTVVTTSATSLQLNDRVSVVTDGQGKPYVFVASSETRKFSSYNASKNEISFKISRVGDQSKFTLDAGVKLLTEDGASLNFNQLKDNDSITMYMLNGKIIELVKQ